MLLICCFCCPTLLAQEDVSPIVTDRPSQTTGPAVIPHRSAHAQLETGFVFLKPEPEAAGESSKIYALNNLIRLSIAERLELRVIVQPELQNVYGDDGNIYSQYVFGDLQAGVKYALMKEKAGRPEVSLISHVVLPHADGNRNWGKYGLLNILAVNHPLSANHNLTWNLGYDYYWESNGNLFYSLSWSIAVIERFSFFIEHYANFENMRVLKAGADAGVLYLLNKNLQLDYTFGTGVNYPGYFHTAGVGILFRR